MKIARLRCGVNFGPGVRAGVPHTKLDLVSPLVSVGRLDKYQPVGVRQSVDWLTMVKLSVFEQSTTRVLSTDGI